MMERLIATGFGLGHLRPAPGTWASAATIALGYGLHRLGHFPLVAMVTLLVTLLGFWVVGKATHGRAEKDESAIVIDEVAGQMIALCATSGGFWFAGMPASVFPWPAYVVPFLFFRLFDIWKPWIIGRADRRSHAAGVLLGDIRARKVAAPAAIQAAPSGAPKRQA